MCVVARRLWDSAGGRGGWSHDLVVCSAFVGPRRGWGQAVPQCAWLLGVCGTAPGDGAGGPTMCVVARRLWDHAGVGRGGT